MKAQNQQTLDQLGGLAKRCKPKLPPAAGSEPKTNLVHSKVARKPLVAIILGKCTFYSRTIKISSR